MINQSTGQELWLYIETPIEVQNIIKHIKYGRLYNIYAVNDIRGLAPIGWHVASNEEWKTLITYLGGSNIAGGKLKEVGLSHWNSPNIGATNIVGFTALAGGYLHFDNVCYNKGIYAYFWTSSLYEDNPGLYATASITNNSNVLVHSAASPNNVGFSVRCIRDEGNIETTVTDIDGNNYTSVTIGTQTWMVENLATTRYRNSDLIGSNFNSTIGAVMAYEFDENNVYDIKIPNIPKKFFYAGVTWSDYSVNGDGSYTIHSDINGEVRDYIIPKENALETNRFIRATNIPTDEWQYRQRLPQTTDYIKAAKDYLGITISSDATFRDGENPHIKREESTD